MGTHSWLMSCLVYYTNHKRQYYIRLVGFPQAEKLRVFGMLLPALSVKYTVRCLDCYGSRRCCAVRIERVYDKFKIFLFHQRLYIPVSSVCRVERLYRQSAARDCIAQR